MRIEQAEIQKRASFLMGQIKQIPGGEILLNTFQSFAVDDPTRSDYVRQLRIDTPVRPRALISRIDIPDHKTTALTATLAVRNYALIGRGVVVDEVEGVDPSLVHTQVELKVMTGLPEYFSPFGANPDIDWPISKLWFFARSYSTDSNSTAIDFGRGNRAGEEGVILSKPHAVLIIDEDSKSRNFNISWDITEKLGSEKGDEYSRDVSVFLGEQIRLQASQSVQGLTNGRSLDINSTANLEQLLAA